MWKAKPVVAGRVGGIQDQIEDGVSGALVDDPADLEAVARAMDAFLADPDEAARVGAAARERVLEHFLGTRHLVQYMQLLEGMLAPERA
jgi:trehalose synthase